MARRVFVGLIKGKRARVGRIKAIGVDLGCKGEGKGKEGREGS